jgi:hypothetical protein
MDLRNPGIPHFPLDAPGSMVFWPVFRNTRRSQAATAVLEFQKNFFSYSEFGLGENGTMGYK